MIGGTRSGKSYLLEGMLRRFGEEHQGKRAVLLLTKRGENELIYPGAPVAEVVEDPSELEG